MNSDKASPHLTAKIVQSYVRHHRMEPNQLAGLITSVHQAIDQLGKPPEPEEMRTPAVPVRRSVHRDYIVCLECGYRAKTMRRHISARHGLGRDEYLQRWGLRPDYPLTGSAYSERRSTLAKALGLGRKPAARVNPADMAIAAPAPANATENPKVRRASGLRRLSTPTVPLARPQCRRPPAGGGLRLELRHGRHRTNREGSFRSRHVRLRYPLSP